MIPKKWQMIIDTTGTSIFINQKTIYVLTVNSGDESIVAVTDTNNSIQKWK